MQGGGLGIKKGYSLGLGGGAKGALLARYYTRSHRPETASYSVHDNGRHQRVSLAFRNGVSGVHRGFSIPTTTKTFNLHWDRKSGQSAGRDAK